MVKIENHLGKIILSYDYLSKLVGNAAQSCFGVSGMTTTGPTQGLRDLFSKKDYPSKGIGVKGDCTSLTFDLHIIVTYGVNISAIAESIVHKVTYVVEEATGINVKKVNVFVDGMKS